MPDANGEQSDAVSGDGHSITYLAAAAELARAIDPRALDDMARGLSAVRARDGRLFILGDVWHALVSHPGLAVKQGHWESLAGAGRP